MVINLSTLRSRQKYLDNFDMRWRRRLKKICWTDSVRNEEILHTSRVGKERNFRHTREIERLTGLVTCLGTAF